MYAGYRTLVFQHQQLKVHHFDFRLMVKRNNTLCTASGIVLCSYTAHVSVTSLLHAISLPPHRFWITRTDCIKF